MAASVSMRGVAIPLRGSTIVRPVVFRRLAIPVGESSGCAWRIRAAAPATAGQAAEVPWKYSSEPPLVTTSQKAPGASSERFEAELEKQTIVSGATDESSHSVPPESSDQPTWAKVSGYTAPTETALEMQAGAAIALSQPVVPGSDDEDDPGRVGRVDGLDVVGVDDRRSIRARARPSALRRRTG